MVALNYQSSDLPMVNEGLFSHENGGCGYILKPPQCQPSNGDSPPGSQRPAVTQCVIELRVLSGHDLPKPDGARWRMTGDEAIKPMVRVSLCGAAPDRVTQETCRVMDNGFNPCWNWTMTFRVTEPDVAVLAFEVFHVSSASDGRTVTPSTPSNAEPSEVEPPARSRGSDRISESSGSSAASSVPRTRLSRTGGSCGAAPAAAPSATRARTASLRRRRLRGVRRLPRRGRGPGQGPCLRPRSQGSSWSPPRPSRCAACARASAGPPSATAGSARGNAAGCSSTAASPGPGPTRGGERPRAAPRGPQRRLPHLPPPLRAPPRPAPRSLSPRRRTRPLPPTCAPAAPTACRPKGWISPRRRTSRRTSLTCARRTAPSSQSDRAPAGHLFAP
ncbi:unnamed protein product [Prorocentrum cordatum]|uniref:phosphoinositide phospholipase C n=1 Tax=Prorocentrum cordatum TaxID=2364126 RepID=A0ABN9V9C1_9DINO|nr:unnamed protein product [Polarella glacialis]